MIDRFYTSIFTVHEFTIKKYVERFPHFLITFEQLCFLYLDPDPGPNFKKKSGSGTAESVSGSETQAPGTEPDL